MAERLVANQSAGVRFSLPAHDPRLGNPRFSQSFLCGELPFSDPLPFKS